MIHRLNTLWSNNKHILRPVISIFILSLWLSWDIYQAHSNSAGVYRSFFKASSITSTGPATVSIVRSNDPALAHPCDVTEEGITYQTINEMVQRAVNLAGGLSSIVHSGDTVLIKPNIVQQDSTGSGGVTDVRVVKALVYMVDAIDHGNIKIIVGDGSPRPFTTFEKASGGSGTPWIQIFDVPGYQLLKTEALSAGIDFRLSNLNGNHDTNPWPELDSVNIAGGGYASPQGGHYYVHQDVTHASVYINVPVMKIHDQPGFTGSLKNQIGLAASTRYGFNKTVGVTQESRYHKLIHAGQVPYNWQDKEIVDLSIIARIKLNVIDAINCLELKKSPVYDATKRNINISNRVKMNTVLAGYDPVAVDNVCCRVMGLNPDDIEHITLAERAGLGTNNSDDITVVGTTIAATKRVFIKGQTPSAWYGQSNRIWLLNGPYSTTGIPSPMNYEFVANEDSVAPAAGVDGWSQPIYFTNDQIMLKDYYGLGTQSVVSYAFTYFNAPSTQTAELWVGSDEALKIYVNGQVVYNYSGSRTFSGGTYWFDIVSINVNQGLNTLLVKAYQGTSTAIYNFSLNICEVQPDVYYRGNRILGLKFTPTGAAPSAPQNLAATAGNGQATLRWNKNSELNITKYRIYQGISSPATTLVDSTSSVTDTVKIINGLSNGTTYFFRVTAVNNAYDESGYSNEVSATPESTLVSTTDININQGWNIVSVPRIQSNDTATAVFPDLYGAMYEFVSGIGYAPVTTLDLGIGYWLYYQTPDTVTITGAEPGSLIVNAKLGWNIIGSRHTLVDLSNLVLSGGNTISGEVAYCLVPGMGYSPITTISPGQGVWVYVVGTTTDFTITIP